MKRSVATKLTGPNNGQNHDYAKNRDFEVHALSHLEDLYRTASYVVVNDSQAQELVQDSLCTAYKYWNKNHSGASCRVWLYRIFANAYIKKYRPFPSLSEAINVAYWPEGYRTNSRPVIQLPHDDSGEILSISMNTAINMASESEEFQPQSRFSVPDAGVNSSVVRASVINVAFNNGDGPDEFQPKRRSATWLRTNDVDETTHADINSTDVKRAIRALPDDVRLLVVLSLLAGFSYGEIAQVAGIHLETVRSRLPRGRKLFRESFATMWRTEEVRHMHRQSEER